MCACHTDRYCIDGSWRDDDIDTVVRTLLHLPEWQLLLRLIATIEVKEAFCVLDHGPGPCNLTSLNHSLYGPKGLERHTLITLIRDCRGRNISFAQRPLPDSLFGVIDVRLSHREVTMTTISNSVFALRAPELLLANMSLQTWLLAFMCPRSNILM